LRSYRYDRILVPTLQLDYTLLLMRQNGLAGLERYVIWAGTIADGDAHVSTVILPRTADRGLHGEVPADVVASVFEALDERDLLPIAQLHTHPTAARMSVTDAERPLVAIAGFRSIIVPDFAFTPADDVDTWNVYRYDAPGNWTLEQDLIVVDDALIRID
jgi:hypothetical protein